MLRSVLGVIIGYIVMFILNVAAFTTIYTIVGGKAPLVLAVVVLLIGLALAAAHTATQPAETNETRGASTPNMEAMVKARHPVWVVFLGPFIGAVGVVIGGKLRSRT